MDVLELPRPVINFLRTMAKESCRYVLSWDIFGGTDTVTLTLTWKLNDNESQASLSSKFPQQQICEDLYIHHNDSMSLLRRSRRENNTSTLNRIHSSRGTSLEGNDLMSTKQIHSHQKQISSLERKPITNQQKEETEPIYTNLNNIKYSTNSSPCFQLNKNLPPSLTHTRHHHYRTKKHGENSIRRKSILSTSTISDISLESRGTNHINNQNDDDDDDILDPWVKHFECSIDDNTIEKSENNLIRTGSTSGKVKFKREPDYI